MPRKSATQVGPSYVPPRDVPLYELRCEMERRYNLRRVSRLMVEGVMRHEPSNNRRGMVDAAPSSASATRILATERHYVRDSHDARSAADRSRERPYSETTFLKDLARGRSPRRRCGDPVSLRVPSWYIALLYSSDVSSETRTAALAAFERVPFEEPKRERKSRQTRRVNVSESRAARQRAIAGVIRMAEQD